VQVPCSEGVANHTGPRVMAVSPKGLWQALTGAGMGWASSRERIRFGVPTAWDSSEGITGHIANARCG